MCCVVCMLYECFFVSFDFAFFFSRRCLSLCFVWLRLNTHTHTVICCCALCSFICEAINISTWFFFICIQNKTNKKIWTWVFTWIDQLRIGLWSIIDAMLRDLFTAADLWWNKVLSSIKIINSFDCNSRNVCKFDFKFFNKSYSLSSAFAVSQHN